MNRYSGTLLVSCALAAGSAFAQESASGFGERVEVEVVNVDVVVTDRDGNRVTDLGREDFAIEIDGRTIPIDYFSPPSAKRPALAAAPAPALGAAPEAASESVDVSTANLFVFVRHEESVLNLEGRINGDPTVEVPLTEEGEAQSHRLAAEIANVPLEACVHTRFGRRWYEQ